RPAGGRGAGAPGGTGSSRGRPPAAGARPASSRPRAKENVEKPRTDDNAVSAEGREQPVIEPQVETTPKPVADAPDTTTTKKQVEDPTKLDQSGDPSAEKPKRGTKKTRGQEAPAAKPPTPSPESGGGES